MERWIIALLILSNLYFAWRWRMTELSVEGFAFYIIKKGYTPPTKEECVSASEVVYEKKLRNGVFNNFRNNKSTM